MGVRDGKIVHRCSLPAGKGGKDAVIGMVYQTPWGHWFEIIKVFKDKEGKIAKGTLFSAGERNQVEAILANLMNFMSQPRKRNDE